MAKSTSEPHRGLLANEGKKMFKRFFLLTAVLIHLTGRASFAVPQEAPASELTLRQTIDMALENNLDIVVARLTTQSQEEGVFSALGAYKPRIGVAFNNLDTRNPSTSQLDGADVNTRTTTTYNFTWQQVFANGLDYSIAFDNRRASTNSVFSQFNPSYNSGVTARITQPLLKNMGLNPNQQRVVTARNSERGARHQFEARVMDVVRDVQIAYWDLVQSIRNLEVTQKSLDLARDLHRNNLVQVEVGTMAAIDVLEAEAEVAVREEAVIVAEEAIERNEDLLKRLINDPDSEDFWGMNITPVDQPTESEFQIDLEASVRTAIGRRPEISQSRANMDTQSYNVRYTRNQLRPQVDVVGSFALSGVGGTQFIRGGFLGDITDEIPGGYEDALGQLVDTDFRDWSVGLNITYPVGHSSEAAAHAQAQVNYRQQRTSIESQELVIAQEVRAAARSIETNRKRIQATSVARELSQRRLEAEQKKFDLGMSTSFLIVQAQRDLAQAEVNGLTATIDYNKALVVFERARGTLLDRENISVR